MSLSGSEELPILVTNKNNYTESHATGGRKIKRKPPNPERELQEPRVGVSPKISVLKRSVNVFWLLYGLQFDHEGEHQPTTTTKRARVFYAIRTRSVVDVVITILSISHVGIYPNSEIRTFPPCAASEANMN